MASAALRRPSVISALRQAMNIGFQAIKGNMHLGFHRFSIFNEFVEQLKGEATDLPDYIDWRERGAVAPIKDQGAGDSCWAFAAVSAIESLNYITTGNLITLSEQQLLDCMKYKKCGGDELKAFHYVVENGGISRDDIYPYIGKRGRCRNYEKSITIDGYVDLPAKNEQIMKIAKIAVAKQPICVGGIFIGKCGVEENHSMTIVGYGTERGNDYWIVRNSWGIEWGEGGYIKMPRNVRNPMGKCGIAMTPSMPIKVLV